MASGDVKLVYREATAFVVTALQSHPTSSDLRTGFTSAYYENTAGDLDVIVTGQFVSGTGTLTAGVMQVRIIPALHDVGGTFVWPDVYSTGTEGTASASAVFHGVQQRDASPVIWESSSDATVSRPYPLEGISVRAALGYVPKRFVLFVAHNSGQNLAASGNGLWATGVYENIAA